MNRMKEPSTYASIAAMLGTLAGALAQSGMVKAAAVLAALAGVAGAVGAVLPEKGSK